MNSGNAPKAIPRPTPKQVRAAYSHTTESAKKMKSHPKTIGHKVIDIARLLPTVLAKHGPKMAPISRPAFTKDATHDACRVSSGIGEFGEVKVAKVGEVHPAIIPGCITKNAAAIQESFFIPPFSSVKIKKVFQYSFYLHTQRTIVGRQS